MPLFDGCQFGCVASALSACQTPPPAAPMKTAQLKAVQFGATAIESVRGLGASGSPYAVFNAVLAQKIKEAYGGRRWAASRRAQKRPRA